MSRVWRGTAGLLAVALAVAGCGLSEDSGPQAIRTDELPADLLDPNTSTSTTLTGVTTTVTVYLIRGEGDETHLEPVTREVEDPTRAGERIDALLSPTTEQEQDDGLISSIPSDTALLGTELDEETDELVIDLSGALFDVEATELAQAFAQIVWTVSEMEGVRRVRFRVDGEDFRAPNAEGIEQDGAVTTADYRALAPE